MIPVDRSDVPAHQPSREAYEEPVLRRYGAAADVTQRVAMSGLPDGGPGAGSMSRTG